MLREEQIHRYARHIVLGAVGVRGQQTLLESTETVRVGSERGSSACALTYLAAAGVGTIRAIGDVDGSVGADEVTRSLLLTRADIGRPRLEALRERVAALNPDVALVAGPAEAVASIDVDEHRELADAIAAGAAAATRAVTRTLARSPA